MSLSVREATGDDTLGVRRILDAAMLQIRDDLDERIAAGDVLVATEGDSPILGALVLVSREQDERGAHLDAVAVRRSRRGQGVGSELVRAAVERRGRLTVEFDPGVRPFYESLGFEISRTEADGDRLRGRYESGS